MLNESPVLKLGVSLSKLFLGIHHNRSIPGDRFFDRFSRNQQKANTLLPGLHQYFISVIKQNQRTITEFIRNGGRGGSNLLGSDRLWSRAIAESPRAGKDIGKCITGSFNCKPLALSGRNRNIKIL